VGPGMDAGTEMGPLVSRKQLDRVMGFVDEARGDGAEVLAGGSRMERPGYFMRPTVLAGVDHRMNAVREEIFGPVLCAMKFHDIPEVIIKANDTDYGLAASIWTRDLARA